jgi:epoxyqueuosine reductase
MSLSYDDVENAALGRHLCIRGGFHPNDLPGVGTLFLLGPDEPAFWPVFSTSQEYQDNQPEPMDRWSARVITELAQHLGGHAFFPFGGPPWHSFIGWAKSSGRAWQSPINLLVHDQAGLFISYRGAIGLPQRINLPPSPGDAPCSACPKPCLTACPVHAFASGSYDVPACKTYLTTEAGQDCMENGCAARRACPISQTFDRLPAQSAFHMRAFL